jgi:hypothetical protein
MKLNHSLEKESHSKIKKIVRHLLKMWVTLPVHKRPPLLPNISQMKHTLTFYFTDIHFNITFQSTRRSPKLSISFMFFN